MPDLTELMRLHTQALYTCNPLGELVASARWEGGDAPRVHIAETGATRYALFRHDVSRDQRVRVEQLLGTDNFWQACLEAMSPTANVWTGPAYAATSSRTNVNSGIIQVSEENQRVLERYLPEWLPDIPHCQPMIAKLVDGDAVAVCASVRITNQAMEAGVETAPDFRRAGHARDAVAAWIAALQARGLTALYSTSSDNLASQAVARTLGLTPIGVDYHLL